MRVEPGRFRGAVLRRGDDGYDDARRVFNAMIDRHPALIVRCADREDVAAAVAVAREEGMPLAVKGGGHGVAGNAVCNDGLVVDLGAMRRTEIDPERRVATVDAGLTLADLDDATARFGLATPTGIVSVTGLSGLALGGGLGWLNGAYGLTCDNLLSVALVTADAEHVVASRDENADLFWAVRGGGGNFGVATSFTLQLHPVDRVLAGSLAYPAARARDALRAYHDVAATAPDHLSINASVYRTDEGEPGVAVAYCCLGDGGDLGNLLRPMRAAGPGTETAEPVPYPVLQRASDAGFPEGRQHYWKSASLSRLDDDAIAVVLDAVARMPSPFSGIGLQQLHGAAARVAPTATAYPHRSVRYDLLILSQWDDPADATGNIAWTSELFEAMHPHLGAGVYLNNLGDEGPQRVRQAFGPNYDRLVEIKTAVDPTNLFRGNQNIPPRSLDAGPMRTAPMAS